jgi:uncharacterized protein (UPF0218 family)
MPISPDDLQKLKKPFGELVPDRDVTAERLRAIISGAKKIVTVGDATTERMIAFGILPDLAVIDGRERRARTNRKIKFPAKEFRCTNPSGEISKGAIAVLEQAAAAERSIVIVDGEEDLLALPLFYLLPSGSIVLYGQPLEGLVAVRITAAKKNEAKTLMDRIISSSKSGTTPGRMAEGRAKT